MGEENIIDNRVPWDIITQTGRVLMTHVKKIFPQEWE